MRFLMFLWIAATAFSVSQLYGDAYAISKKNSNIIKSLIRILFWISVVFTHLSITALLLVLNPDLHKIAISLMPITILPMGFLITKFRKDSIKRQEESK